MKSPGNTRALRDVVGSCTSAPPAWLPGRLAFGPGAAHRSAQSSPQDHILQMLRRLCEPHLPPPEEKFMFFTVRMRACRRKCGPLQGRVLRVEEGEGAQKRRMKKKERVRDRDVVNHRLPAVHELARSVV
eukprot:scaffold6386_cov114-Isochrysis_galbana.AAC.3